MGSCRERTPARPHSQEGVRNRLADQASTAVIRKSRGSRLGHQEDTLAQISWPTIIGVRERRGFIRGCGERGTGDLGSLDGRTLVPL